MNKIISLLFLCLLFAFLTFFITALDFVNARSQIQNNEIIESLKELKKEYSILKETDYNVYENADSDYTTCIDNQLFLRWDENQYLLIYEIQNNKMIISKCNEL